MSATSEAPGQYERDLRSASKEWKRGKDSAIKWSYGTRPLAGCRVNFLTGEVVGGTEHQRGKCRPEGKHSSHSGHMKQNVNKFTRANYTTAPRVARSKMSAHEEMASSSRSIADMLPPTPGTLSRSMSASDNFLYSFDREDTPGRPLTLDVFVKPATARDTERFVEREYEILDANGQALKGRKARQNLRRGAEDSHQVAAEVMEDEGFELV